MSTRCCCSCGPCLIGVCDNCTQANAWCSDATRQAVDAKREARLAIHATAIVSAIEDDARDRSLFADVDGDVRDEIRASWHALVLERLKEIP